jgi:hypothetical protein
MYCLVLLFNGGLVTEIGEFENMTELVETFDGPSTFKDVVDCAMVYYGVGMHEVTFRGHFDCGKAIANMAPFAICSS